MIKPMLAYKVDKKPVDWSESRQETCRLVRESFLTT